MRSSLTDLRVIGLNDVEGPLRRSRSDVKWPNAQEKENIIREVDFSDSCEASSDTELAVAQLSSELIHNIDSPLDPLSIWSPCRVEQGQASPEWSISNNHRSGLELTLDWLRESDAELNVWEGNRCILQHQRRGFNIAFSSVQSGGNSTRQLYFYIADWIVGKLVLFKQTAKSGRRIREIH